eukprot:gene16397-18034_t
MPGAINNRLMLQRNLILIIGLLRKKKQLLTRKKYKKKRFWVRKIFQERERSGHFHALIQELRIHNREYFFRFLRMSPEKFEHLYRIVGPHMKTRQCRNREPIPNAERLALTIRCLASGDSEQSMSFNFRVSRSVPIFMMTPSDRQQKMLLELVVKCINRPYCLCCIADQFYLDGCNTVAPK